MIYVDILRTDYDGNQEEILRFSLEDDKIVAENLNGSTIDYKDLLEEDKYIIGLRAKKISINDGMEFLKNLKYAFSGSILRATEIIRG